MNNRVDIDAISALEHVTVQRLDRLRGLGEVRAVTFVGGMCAGKSTVAREIATNRLTRDCCVLAARVTTRDRRRGDTTEQVSFLTWHQFEERRRKGDLALSWVRPLVGGGAIGYGCEHVETGRVALQVAGHGIYTNSGSVLPAEALAHSVVVGVYAPDEVRFDRVRCRSPDLAAAQLAVLMQHDDERMFAETDVVVHNFGAVPDRPLQDAVNLTSALGLIARAPGAASS